MTTEDAQRCAMFGGKYGVDECTRRAKFTVLTPMSPGSPSGGWERPTCGVAGHLKQAIVQAAERLTEPDDMVEVRVLRTPGGVSVTTNPPTAQQIRQLSGLRRAMYHAALSRNMEPAKAYRLASARCCEPTDGAEHTQACIDSLDYS